MNVWLSVMQEVRDEWTFRIEFGNVSDSPTSVTLGAIERSGSRMGLQFSLSGNEIEPVDEMLISPRSVAPEGDVPPRGSVSVDFAGHVERKSEDFFCSRARERHV